jgi:acetoin utilization deacetylase AcuC-like enzyme
MAESSGDVAFEKAFRDILIPAADRFKPDLILVSAGFDPHRNDLAMNLTYDGFKAITDIVQGIADKHCKGKLAFVLEGGYNLTSLSRGVHSVLEVLTGGKVPKVSEIGIKEVENAADFHLSAFTDDDPMSPT